MTEEIKNRVEQIRRGDVPEGYKKTKVGIVPKEWYENVLGEYISEHRELTNDISTYPVYSSSRQGLVPHAEYYDEKEASETNLGYKIVSDGFVTYRHMSDDDIFHFNINQTGTSVLVSSEYPVFSASHKGCLYYLMTFLNEMPRFKFFCREQKMGGTRTRLYYKNLCLYKAAFPSLSEQQSIAEILMQCDKALALKQAKIAELKNLKKACMDKMFPKEGSIIPEVRFPGFTDAWEQRKLGEVAEFNPKSNLPEVFEYVDLESVVGTEMINHRTERKGTAPSRAQRVAQEGDLFYQTVRPYQRNNFLLENADVTYVFSTGYAQMRPHVDGHFLLSFVQTDLLVAKVLDRCTGTSYPAINANDLADMDVRIPASPEEQQEIGDYFCNLDHLITLQQRELDETQKFRKALMQLLLTGIVRVSV